MTALHPAQLPTLLLLKKCHPQQKIKGKKCFIEYASPVLHYRIPKYLCKDIERIQRRNMTIIYPGKCYNEALSMCDLKTLEERRQISCDQLFNQIIEDPNHRFDTLLRELNTNTTHSLANKKR